MGSDPWNSAEGRYDRPTSSVPRPRQADAPKRPVVAIAPAAGPIADRPMAAGDCPIERRMRAAAQDGVVAVGGDSIVAVGGDSIVAVGGDSIVAVGGDSIVARIDDALRAIVDKGHGRATAIYLTDVDLLALGAALGRTPHEYAELRIAAGATSKVYSKRGSVPVRRPRSVKPVPASPPSMFDPPV